MKEDLLHFIWKYKKLQLQDLFTTKGEIIQILNTGLHNHLAGPDFFNAQVEIDDQLWAGNIEIHIKASDWYAHNHQSDPNYNTVILHVVWENDAEVFRNDNSAIPTLELKKLIPKSLLIAYKKLFDSEKKSFINCEKEIALISSFTLSNWLERLYFERLEKKSENISELLLQNKNDWEHTLFVMLLKNFGLNINGDAFLSLAQALAYSVVRKLQSKPMQLESVLFGMSQLLDESNIVDSYYLQLQKEFCFLKSKFNLVAGAVLKPYFFKLRPPNFPTIRLSQFARLYGKHQNLFDKLIAAATLNDLYTIFEIEAAGYWKDHYTFGKVSKKSCKKLTKKFIDLLIINTILPIKFCYARHQGKAVEEMLLVIVRELKPEINAVTTNYKVLGIAVENGADSQAVLQLHKEYCLKNKCLECAVGMKLMGS